jgi:hypothetical protein
VRYKLAEQVLEGEMSDRAKVDTSAARVDGKPAEGRKPYAAPSLKRLGSVRELTLGSGSTGPDGGGMLNP